MSGMTQRPIFAGLALVVIAVSVTNFLQSSPDFSGDVAFASGGATVILGLGLYFAIVSSRARSAARRLRTEQPDAEVFLVEADNYFLGSIAQLRPDLPEVAKTWGWKAYCFSSRGFQIWGGKRGKVILLQSSWEYVRSLEIGEARLVGVAFPALVTVLNGAEVLPLRLTIHRRGIGWLWAMSRPGMAATLARIESIRSRALAQGATEPGR